MLAMADKKNWIKKKNMTPEERKAYDHYYFEFSDRYFKAHTILFFVWLIVLTVGYIFEFKGPQLSDVNRLIFTTIHTLWSLAGLTATLVFDHYTRKYAQEHLHEPYDTGDSDDTITQIDIDVTIEKKDAKKEDKEDAPADAEKDEKPEEEPNEPNEN